MLSKIGAIASVIVVIGVLVMGYLLYYQHNQLSQLRIDLERTRSLYKGNLIPLSVMADIAVLKSQITEIYRLGPDTVIVTQSYLPPESEVHYVTELNEEVWEHLQHIYQQLVVLELSGDTIGLSQLKVDLEALKYQLYTTAVSFDRYGFCVEPVIGISVNNDVNEELVIGARLAYWNRYGLGLHGVITDYNDLQFGMGGFVDGRLPYLQNVGGFFGGSYNLTKQDWNLRMGVQGYLN